MERLEPDVALYLGACVCLCVSVCVYVSLSVVRVDCVGARRASVCVVRTPRAHCALQENTAKQVPGEVWAIGRGLIQVSAAYEWLAAHARTYRDVAVYADEPRKGGRGVVLREPQETSVKQEVEMRINSV